MRYRAINVYESKGNQVVVEYEIIPGPLMAMLGAQPTFTMARGSGRNWVEERAQSFSQISEIHLKGKVVDFLEQTAAEFKKLPAAA
ncbi:hypothetical protein PLCT1_00886 [Planctomycetaceae bacterium]|nr:hypothetical protein PLCT1_00886 [Planctomycetaceae bacterium]